MIILSEIYSILVFMVEKEAKKKYIDTLLLTFLEGLIELSILILETTVCVILAP